MGNRLYVGNLPFGVTSDKLKEAFSKFGEVETAEVVMTKFGRSKGFGFVAFKNEADAEKARAEMNGKDFDGRTLTVNEATPFDPNKPRERKPFRSGGFGGGGFGGRSGGFRSGGGNRRFGSGNRRFGDRRNDKSGSDESSDSDNFDEG